MPHGKGRGRGRSWKGREGNGIGRIRHMGREGKLSEWDWENTAHGEGREGRKGKRLKGGKGRKLGGDAVR